MKRLEISGTANDHLGENEARQLEDGLRILARVIVRALLQERSLMARSKYEECPDSAVYPYRVTAAGRPDEPLTLSVAATAKVLGLSRNSVYGAIRTGQIPSIRFGKRIFVPRVALSRIVSQAENFESPDK